MTEPIFSKISFNFDVFAPQGPLFFSIDDSGSLSAVLNFNVRNMTYTKRRCKCWHTWQELEVFNEIHTFCIWRGCPTFVVFFSPPHLILLNWRTKTCITSFIWETCVSLTRSSWVAPQPERLGRPVSLLPWWHPTTMREMREPSSLQLTIRCICWGRCWARSKKSCMWGTLLCWGDLITFFDRIVHVEWRPYH